MEDREQGSPKLAQSTEGFLIACFYCFATVWSYYGFHFYSAF
jgi:hypothetical protein